MRVEHVVIYGGAKYQGKCALTLLCACQNTINPRAKMCPMSHL